MAGSYPDAPGNRLAWHVDGTVAITSDGSSISQFDLSACSAMNDESQSAVTPSTAYVGLFFPRLMDISGFWVSVSGYNTGAPHNFVTSVNATNPLDGTWVSWPSQPTTGNGYRSAAGLGLSGQYDYYAVASPNYRNEIKSLSLTGVKAIRWNMAFGGYFHHYVISTLHVYGRPSAGTNLDRLELWHPTLDERVSGAFFDWGNVSRSDTVLREFRVKNVSDTLTANSVVVAANPSTDPSPALSGMHMFSTGGSYAATTNVGILYPGQISSVVSMRATVPSDASLGVWAMRLSATAGSWT